MTTGRINQVAFLFDVARHTRTSQDVTSNRFGEARTLDEGKCRIMRPVCPDQVPYTRYQATLHGPHHRCISTNKVNHKDRIKVHPTPHEQRKTKRDIYQTDTMPSIRYATQETHKMLKTKMPCRTTEEVSTHGSCCASRHPTTRNKPNTTHAPSRSSFPKAAQLVATHPAQGQASNQKPKQPPECTERCESNKTNTKSVLPRFVPVSPCCWHIECLGNSTCFEQGTRVPILPSKVLQADNTSHQHHYPSQFHRYRILRRHAHITTSSAHQLPVRLVTRCASNKVHNHGGEVVPHPLNRPR